MTAVIGILNKSGVALAADSAVTISGEDGRKIYNTAYKIFTLSKHHPVSIMIYNSASFMGIPWEILIKEYRKFLSNKNFDSLLEYQIDFIKYLKGQLKLISSEQQKITLFLFIDFISKKVIEDVTNENIEKIDKIKTLKGKKKIIETKIIEKIESLLKSFNDDTVLTDFTDYKFDGFKKEHSTNLEESFTKYYSELEFPNTIKNKLFKIIHHLIIAEYFFGKWTGLVFLGYGEKEIYPSCLPIKIGEVVDNRIRYVKDEESAALINDTNSAAIRPFAQRDVIDTILSGIDSNLEEIVYKSFAEFLSSFLFLLKEKIGNDNNLLKEKIDKISVEELINSYSQIFQNLKRNIHIDPLMSSIASLSKEDLAELAESLIYLTYLKRRMSFSEESVGGPIDVAIITKGDGLIWIKRKHYFNKELNQDFIYKYLK